MEQKPVVVKENSYVAQIVSEHNKAAEKKAQKKGENNLRFFCLARYISNLRFTNGFRKYAAKFCNEGRFARSTKQPDDIEAQKRYDVLYLMEKRRF